MLPRPPGGTGGFTNPLPIIRPPGGTLGTNAWGGIPGSGGHTGSTGGEGGGAGLITPPGPSCAICSKVDSWISSNPLIVLLIILALAGTIILLVMV